MGSLGRKQAWGCCNPSDMTGQAPGSSPSRLGRMTTANMLRSMLPLVVMVLALAYFCSPQDVDPVAVVDPSNSIRYAASLSEVALLVPELGEDWRPTSVDVVAPRDGQPGPVSLTIGYVTPTEEFARYVASTDPAAELIDDLLLNADSVGETRIAGQSWEEFTTSRTEALYLLTDGILRVLVTGSASEEELQTLAESLAPYRD